MYAFEKLEVWIKSKFLIKIIYKLTEKFPSEEKFGLTSQLRRASISICSNIAEGSTRWSQKDQARFYEIAFGSLIEVLNQLILSAELKFIDCADLENIRPEIDSIGRMFHALRKSTISRKTQKPINLKTNKPKNQ